jgi:hypothetical protein
MPRKLFLVVLLLIAGILAAYGQQGTPTLGQSTWGGLRFGTSVDDAKQQLAGRIQSEERPSQNPTAFILILKSVLLGHAKGEPHIIFEGGRLIRVVLLFSTEAEGCFDKPDRARDAEKILTIDAVGEAVTGAFQEKYGKPINETGSWPSHDMLINHFAGHREEETFKAVRAWKSGGQVIRISLNIVCDTLFLDISYDPESTGPEI